MALIRDSIVLDSKRTRTAEGFLRATAVIGRAGVLVYQPTDPAVAGAPSSLLSAGRPIRVLRPADEVFSPDSMATFAGRPVLNEHSTAKVTPSNFRDHIVGVTGSQIVRDGDMLRADLTIYDASMIAEIEAGKAQLSQGYDANTVWDSGSDPAFGDYDGRFTNIIGNHIAVTLSGRSGPDVRILDSNNGVKTVKRNFKGIEIDIPDTMVSVVDSYLAESAKTAADLNEANGKIAALNKQIEESKTEYARVTDSAYIENAVKERAALIETAKKIAPAVVCDSLTADAIRAAVVTAKGITVVGVDATRGAFLALASGAMVTTPAAQIADALNSGAAVTKSAEETYNAARAAFMKRGN